MLSSKKLALLFYGSTQWLADGQFPSRYRTACDCDYSADTKNVLPDKIVALKIVMVMLHAEVSPTCHLIRVMQSSLANNDTHKRNPKRHKR